MEDKTPDPKITDIGAYVETFAGKFDVEEFKAESIAA